ncbi:MAG: M48 family metallopeptidase [Sporomusaceae bacterium]|nr:M48 family metallopeptidase [Sporomusaceae bacterium]
MKLRGVRTAVLALSLSLTAGLLQPASSEALDLGDLGGALLGGAIQQAQIKKSLEYYENDGRHELFEQLKKSEGVNEDPELNALLARIMGRLSDAIAKTEPSIQEKPYNYFINPQPEFNAFCSLGHNISVNTGVFNFFDNHEDKVAAVVAHELVHGQKQHPLNGAKKKLTVDFVKSVVGSQMGGGGRLAVGVVAANTKATGITKPNEWEADNIAYNYILAAGYNPGAPAAVWQRVLDSKDSGKSGGFLDDLLNPSTHPEAKDRRDNYAKKLTEHSRKQVTVDAASGEIKVNNRPFMKPTAFANMSGLERSYLVAGNLAAVYARSQPGRAYAENGVVRVDGRAVVQPGPDDPGAAELAQLLNAALGY